MIWRARTCVASRRGRPRSTAIDLRILQGALRLFARTGWADFSMEMAARHANVSKATLYLRWSNKASLLADALRHAYPTWTIDGDLPVEAALVELVSLMTFELSSESGWALYGALRDPHLPPGLRNFCREIVQTRSAMFDALISHARDLGLLPSGISSHLIRKTLIGAAFGEAGEILLTGRMSEKDEARAFATGLISLILSLSPDGMGKLEA
ncbi:TetR/AcrR family transcriptional regulator [Sphingomonas koreensis]